VLEAAHLCKWLTINHITLGQHPPPTPSINMSRGIAITCNSAVFEFMNLVRFDFEMYLISQYVT
jgi:hypothetical protein